ncbi:MAG: nickel insertion protein, partial [Christensenellaceae bacterium]|nr:nickel insertion protein [Christensenellaceae bacterium]
MKLLYLECAMGASGDMLMGALVGLLENPEEFVREMNALGLPGVRVRMEPSVKCGITGTHMSVTVRGEEEESLDHHGHAHDHGHDHDHPHDHGHDHPHVHDHPHGHSHTGIREIEH